MAKHINSKHIKMSTEIVFNYTTNPWTFCKHWMVLKKISRERGGNYKKNIRISLEVYIIRWSNLATTEVIIV